MENLETRRLLASITASAFNSDFAPQSLGYTFNSDVSAELSLNQFVLDHLSGNASLPRSGMSMSWNGSTNTATVTPTTAGSPAILADGWYDAIWSEVDSPLTNEHKHTFRWLLGDFNNDGAVGSDDQSYFISMLMGGTPNGVGHSAGDVNFDGATNNLDIATFSDQYGKQIPSLIDMTQSITATPLSSTTARVQLRVPVRPPVRPGQPAPPPEPTPTHDGYRIYRSDNATDFSQVGEVLTTSNSFAWDDTSLAHGTKYWYRIRPFTFANGNGHTTPKVSAVTVMPGASNLQVTSVHSHSIALSWTDSAVGETGYVLERSESNTYADPVVFQLPADSNSFVDWGLEPDTQYWYRVRSVKDVVQSAWAPTTGTTLPLDPQLAAPTNLHVAAQWTTAIALEWNDNSTGETAYVVQRSTKADFGSGPITEFVLSPNSTEFEDDQLTPGTGYWYRVFATSATGSSEYAEVETHTILPAATSLAGVGTAFIDGITFSWTDNADNEDGYLIEWSDDGTEWFGIGETGENQTSYTDEYPKFGVNNLYRVRSFRAGEMFVESQPTPSISLLGHAPAITFSDDNAGPNERGTLSPYHTTHGTMVEVYPLANDVDYDAYASSPLTIASFTQPANGTVVPVNPTFGLPYFEYTPANGFVGTDSFEYVVFEGTAYSGVAKVTIDVTNDAPVPGERQITWSELPVAGSSPALEAAIQLAATDPEGDSFTFVIEDQPAFGSLDAEYSYSGEFVYIPDTSYRGVDSFTFYIVDSLGAQSDPQRVELSRDGLMAVIGQAVNVPINFVPNPPPGLIHEHVLGSTGLFNFSVASAHLPANGALEVFWTEWVGVLPNAYPIVHSEPLVPGTIYPEGHLLFYKPNTGFSGSDETFITYHSNDVEISKPSHIMLKVTNDTPLEVVPEPFARFGIDPMEMDGPSLIVSDLRDWLNVEDPEIDVSFTVAVDGENGNAVVNNNNGVDELIYTPTMDDGVPSLAYDFFRLDITVEDVGTLQQWIQIDPGYIAPPPPIRSTGPVEDVAPQSDWAPAVSQWSSVAFNGSLEALYSKLTLVQAKRNAIVQAVAALGNVWMGIAQLGDDPDEAMSAIDDADAALVNVKSAYLTYLDGWLELNENAAEYQNSWTAAFDNYWDPDTYHMVQNGITALSNQFGGLKPSIDYHARIKQAFDDYGDAAGFQSNVAGSIFTIAEQTHSVLEKAEYTMALLSGGTLAGVTITTKAVLGQLVKTVARNYLIMEIAEAAVTPVMGGVIALAAHAGVSPIAVQTGMLALQATGLASAAKVRLHDTPRPFRGPLRYVDDRMLPFPGVTTRSRQFTIKSEQQIGQMRVDFERVDGPRDQFVKHLANNHADALRRANISETDILRMKDGGVPRGFDVHHKDPLQFGGDNSLDNLILMQKGSETSGRVNFHGALTNYQGSLARYLDEGTTFEAQWPVFNGVVYP